MLLPHSSLRLALAATLALATLNTVATAAETSVPPPVPPAALLDRPFGDADVADFKVPPKTFFPETWFHYLGGNVSKEGITADLEAIATAGLSGVQLFHGSQGGGKWPGVKDSVTCLSPRWDDYVRHTAAEAQRLGIRFTMQNCPGWSMAGGPWIKPENAMRHLTWSRTDVAAPKAGEAIAAQLPAPSRLAGDYRDIVVLAFPTPLGDTGQSLQAVSALDLAPLEGTKRLPWKDFFCAKGGIALPPAPAAKPHHVEITFAAPVVLRSFEFPNPNSMSHPFCYTPDLTVALEAVFPDGKTQSLLRAALPSGSWQGDRPITFALPETSAGAATYRLTIFNEHHMGLRPGSVRFSTAARKNSWESEAGWTLRGPLRVNDGNLAQNPAAWVPSENILDITTQFDAASGKLAWTPPASAATPTGQWTILRVGHANSGPRNAPAPREATGWECDKLSDAGPAAHYAGYIGRLADGPLKGGLLGGILLDSWECRTQTWTTTMEADFRAHAGYDLRRWLPAVFGYVVATPDTTARFLRDWRGNIGDLFANRFYAGMAKRARADGLAVSYETAAGDIFPADILEYYKHADIPMTEFWQPFSKGFVGDINFKPIKPTASAARLYGKPRVAAEAFTSFSLTWNEHFDMLKEVANVKSVEGVTHMVFHNYTHNPRVDGFLPPGSAFGTNIGTPFLRGQTWWRHMPEFNGYLARLGFMLERGKPVSDVLWYLGDEIPHKPDQNAPFPAGFKYDYCNPDVLLNRISVDAAGNLTTPDGIAYRVLWLADNKRMLPQTLEKIRDLVRAGATIIGNAPEGLATLAGGKEAQARFDAAVKEIWGGAPQANAPRQLGKGTVVSVPPLGDTFKTLDSALTTLSLPADVLGARSEKSPIDDLALWTHRRAANADWYFISAPQGRAFKGKLAFRNAGRAEIWDPATGESRAAVFNRNDSSKAASYSIVSFDLPKAGACFVVFRHDKPVQDSQRLVFAERTRLDGGAPAERGSIISARYGDLAASERCLDVLPAVRTALKKVGGKIAATSEFAGGDPADGIVKQLEIVVQKTDGSKQTIIIPEGATYDLSGELSSEPYTHEISADATAVRAYVSGTYRVHSANGTTNVLTAAKPSVIPLTTPWTLAFPAGWGAPETPLTLDTLKSWNGLTGLSDEARAFSGTAVYTVKFDLPASAVGSPLLLDLGVVEFVAEVKLNGKKVRTLWAPPYRTDISAPAKSGENVLEIAVTSTWYNRLAFDNSRPVAQRKTWTLGGPRGGWGIPYGLLGPVVLRLGEELRIKQP
jgi:hypothetical protein